MVKTLLSTLNAYSREYAKTLNSNMLPAIDRIKEEIEKRSGKKVKVKVKADGTAEYSL